MKILHLDSNHPLLIEQLQAAGFDNDWEYTSSKTEVERTIHQYHGIVVRSRFAIDKTFLDKATHLRCIGRVGAGLENIDLDYAHSKGILVFNAPEGNRNAVGEHTLGMLLSLFNNMNVADREVRQGLWQREQNRGVELEGKTVGILGYGNMGRAFAQKLSGFAVEVLCYDIQPKLGDRYARQVSLAELFEKTEVLSLHTPQTPETIGMVNTRFIHQFAKPFWLINTARGQSVVTSDLVAALENKKILGAALDVLEYEKTSFEQLFSAQKKKPKALENLLKCDNVLLSPHIAGWTVESKIKLAQTIADKIIAHFGKQV